jgi:twitching motility protein PilI
MSKRRHKNHPKGGPHKSGKQVNVRPASSANPNAMDMEDMSAALARALEGMPEPESPEPEFVDESMHEERGHGEAFGMEDAAHHDEPVEAEAMSPDAGAIDVSEAHADAEPPHEKVQVAPEAEPVAEIVRAPHVAAFSKLADYERLSMEHVPGLPEQADAPGAWRGVGFGLGKRRLVAAFEEVVEIMPLPQITNVPGTQHWMLGVANVRGTLLPVVDLKQFLEGERTVIHEGQRVLVVKQGGGNVAVLIDALYGQRSFNDSQKTEAAEDESRYGYFIKQAYKVGDNDWGVFSMAMLARTPEFRQAAA